MLVRSQNAVIADHIVRDRLLRRDTARIPDFRYPLRFQNPEEPLCRGVIPATSSPAETLLHVMAPEQLSESQAGVLALLI